MPSILSSSLATLSMRCVAASSKTPWVTVDARGDPLYQIRLLLRASRDRLTKRQKERLRAAFTADEAHISVEVACHCAQQVRDVFHQDTPAQGQRLATRLVERLPTCPIPEIARLGRTLRKWKDAFLAYFDTAEANNAPHRSRQRNHRTRQTHRQSLPQPHQLPAPNAPHRRRPRRLHPHSTLKSQFGADEFLAGKAALDIEAFAEFFLNVTIDYQRLSQDGRTLLGPPQNQVLLPEHLHLP